MRRALICAPLMPEFDRESGSRRIYDLLTLLREAGWSVSFFAQAAAPEHERYGRALRQLGIPVYAGSHSHWVGDEFTWTPNRLFAVGGFDLAIVAFWYMAEGYLAGLRYFSPQTRVIVDTIDVHFLRNVRRSLGGQATERSLLDAGNDREMARELGAYAAADALLTVSQTEADLLTALLQGSPPAYTVPDMEELVPADEPFERRRGMLLLASFRHPPNREAAEVLCRQVLPLVDPTLLAEHPVFVVGTGLDDEIRSLGAGLPSVRMVGWVPSVEPYLRRCRITLLPLRHGAGTKRKLIQALMVGTPSVSTSVGAEGLALQHERQLLIADDPPAFAAAIERLMVDADLWRRLATAGRDHVVARHGREAVRSALLGAIERVMGQAPVATVRRAATAIGPADGAGAAATTVTERSGAVPRPAFPDGHFYSPVVDVAEVAARQGDYWPAAPPLLDVDLNEAGQRAFLDGVFRRYIADFIYPEDEGAAGGEGQFFTANSQFGGLDARALFVMLRALQPRRMIEIGSGFSSLLTADVNRRFLGGELDFTCIEPYPRPFLVRGVAGISRLLQEKVQAVPPELFAELGEDDILFVDSSHVSKTGSDVNHILFEILPRLRAGVVIHFHDIFLPDEYPKEWVLNEQRSWNEQYLVRALLMNSAAYRVIFSSHYVASHLGEPLREVLGGEYYGGGSLWLRKVIP